MSKRTAIIAALVGLAVVAFFTLVNKRWWGRRIVARWDVTTGTEPGDPWTVYGPDWSKWSIPQLFGAWQKGRAGWFPKGQRPELPTTTEFDVE